MELKGPTKFAVQDLRQSLLIAGKSMSWRKLAMRVAVSLALLSGWLAFSYALVAFLEGREAGWGGPWRVIFRIYLRHWQEVTWLGGIWCVAFWGVIPLWRAMQAPRFSEGAVGAATPGTLGAIRALTCAILLIITLREDLASHALLPASMVNPLGFMMLLHLLPIGYDSFLADSAALRFFHYFTILILSLGMVGLGTRIVVPAGAICFFIFAGILREYSFFYHGGVIPLYALVVMSFTRCDQGWSLDRAWRSMRGKAVEPAHTPTAYYGWARYGVWAVIAIPYVAAGCSKLYYMGLDWMSADSMRWILARTSLELDPHILGAQSDVSLWLMPLPDALFVLVGIGALGTQAIFGLVLFSRRARLMLPALMVGIHISILYLMNILFLDLVLLLWVFYDWGPVKRWLISRWRRALGRGDADSARVSGGGASVGAVVHRWGAMAVMVIMLFLASWWVTKIEFYPLTAMQMFTAHRNSEAGVVSYVQAIAHYEDGSSGRANFANWIGTKQNGNFRPVIRRAFRDADGLAESKEFLDIAIREANAREGEVRVSSVELQQWEWNFRDDPNNPSYGILMDRYVHLAPR